MREQMIERASQSLRGENDWSEDFIEMASPKMADFAIEVGKEQAAEIERLEKELAAINKGAKTNALVNQGLSKQMAEQHQENLRLKSLLHELLPVVEVLADGGKGGLEVNLRKAKEMVERIREAVTTKYIWWCPKCKGAINGSNVTFQERHDSCGTSVDCVLDSYADENKALKSLLRELLPELEKLPEDAMGGTVLSLRGAVVRSTRDIWIERFKDAVK